MKTAILIIQIIDDILKDLLVFLKKISSQVTNRFISFINNICNSIKLLIGKIIYWLTEDFILNLRFFIYIKILNLTPKIRSSTFNCSNCTRRMRITFTNSYVYCSNCKALYLLTFYKKRSYKQRLYTITLQNFKTKEYNKPISTAPIDLICPFCNKNIVNVRDTKIKYKCWYCQKKLKIQSHLYKDEVNNVLYSFNLSFL